MLSTHSPYTVKSTFTTVKHFFKWAYASGLTGTNPALSLRIPPPPPPNPKPISEDTFEKLFDAAKVYGDDLERARNVALRAASLHVPDPRPISDSLIAATALVHGMTVVTRNRADFEPTGVKLLDPWDAR